MKVTISVTKNDIKRGIKGAPFSCPISLAIKRATNKRVINSVTCEEANIYILLGERITYRLPKIAQDFIKEFDSHTRTKNPPPFEFTLNINKKFLK